MDEERMDMLARIASMYFLDDLSQDQIAMRLGFSRSGISRMLTEARQEGIVEIKIIHQLSRNKMLEELMRTNFNIGYVRVLASDGATYETSLRRVGGLAALLLEQVIQVDSVIGVGWGTAIYETARQVRYSVARSLKVVQLMGSAFNVDPKIDGPAVTHTIANSLNGHAYILPAPWLIEEKAVRDALLKDRFMRETLEMAHRTTIAVTGIGTTEPGYSSLVRAGYFSDEQLNQIRASGVVGDVCGFQFDSSGQIRDIPLAGYIFGISIDTLRNIPLRIGIAAGEAKAAAVLGALRAGLVNALVLDDVCAQYVMAMII